MNTNMELKANTKYTLNIKIIDESMYDFYYEKTNDDENAGYDLYLSKDITIEPKNKENKENKEYIQFNSGIQCNMVVEYDKIILNEDGRVTVVNRNVKEDVSYLLMPRSSISKYNLVMANSVGLIDASYRGEILSRVYYLGDKEIKFNKGERLFQIVGPTLKSFEVKIVSELTNTNRGENGFGSSGK